MNAAPRIFISYAHDSTEHGEAVERLWRLLRELTFDAQLDQANPDTVPNWVEWMEREIAAANFVLVIASPAYRVRAAGEGPEREGRGVWYEARRLREMVYADKGKQSLRKILPVVLPGQSPADLPTFFSPYSESYMSIPEITSAGLAELARVLRGEIRLAVPPLGTPSGIRALRRELLIDVSMAGGTVRTHATLSGVALPERDSPLPFEVIHAWDELGQPPRVAADRWAVAGRRLAQTLFDAGALDVITRAVTGLELGDTLDVVITTDGGGLSLPYELIRLADGQPLAAVAGVCVSRQVRGLDRPGPVPTPGPLKILAAVAAPERTTNAPLDVEAEMQAIIDVVGSAQGGSARVGSAQVTILEVASLDQLAAALVRDAYHVLHLSAHGSPTSVELEDEDGNGVPVDAAALMAALRRGERRLPLIVLSSCAGAAHGDTGLAAALVQHGADRVIAMQTSVTDRYATRLMGGVYRALAGHDWPVGRALAHARAALHAETVHAKELTAPPEYGVPTLLTAAGDPRLIDTSAPAVTLHRPDEAPAGTGVRELRLGDLIGRREPLRRTLRALRGETRLRDKHGEVCGVALTGIGGIGKTALAGRVVNRLRTDNTWHIVVHIGRWNPQALLEGIAATVPAEIGAFLLAADTDSQTKLAVVGELLKKTRLLLVFDDFEQNLDIGGAAFDDPGFAHIFAGFCAAATTGKLLVTCRYPVPAGADLLRVDIAPLTASELGRLLLRLPALRDLDADDRKVIVDTIGGHPRLMEFADALIRGQDGRARFLDVAARLRDLAAAERITLASLPSDAPDAREAARQVVLLGSRDVLLDQLLTLLSATQREVLLQAATSRIPFTVDDLAFAINGAERTPDQQSAVRDDARRLLDLTLLSPADGQLVVQGWVGEALVSHQGDELKTRHDRAAAMRLHRLQDGRAGFDDLVEIARHYAAADRIDDLASFAHSVSNQLDGELLVAAFLGEVIPTFPRDHGMFFVLADRERESLLNIGNRAAAHARATHNHDIVHAKAEANPGNVGFQRDLSISYERLGDLAVAAGDPVGARGFFDQALTIRQRLAQADPGNVGFQRDLSISYERLGDLAVAAGDPVGARGFFDQALTIAQRLAQADPGNVGFQRDLSFSYERLGDLAVAAGDPVGARGFFDQALTIRQRLAQADPGNVGFQRDLSVSYNRLGGLAVAAGDPVGARGFFDQALTIRQRLAQADSGNVGFQRDLSVSYNRLGGLAVAAGDPVGARGFFDQALTIAQRLAQADPGNVGFQRDLSISYDRLGGLAVAAGDPVGARGFFDQALTIAQRLAQADPGNVEFQRDLSVSYNKLGGLAVAAGDPVGARGFFDQALAIRQRLAQTDGGNVEFQRDLSVSYNKLAQLALASGDRAEARVLWGRAASLVQRLVEIDSENVRYGNDVGYYRARLAELDESEHGADADVTASTPQLQSEPVPRQRGLLSRLFRR